MAIEGLQDKLPKTLAGLEEERARLIESLDSLRTALSDPGRRSRFATDAEFSEWRGRAFKLKMLVEKRLGRIKAAIVQRVKNRNLEEEALFLDGRDLNPSDPCSYIHALWKMHVQMRKDGVEYDAMSLQLIREARDYLISKKYLAPVKKVIVRPPPEEALKQADS